MIYNDKLLLLIIVNQYYMLRRAVPTFLELRTQTEVHWSRNRTEYDTETLLNRAELQP